MLNEFWELDKQLIHEKYRKIIEEKEKRPAPRKRYQIRYFKKLNKMFIIGCMLE
jgi:hypothetical protein